MLLKSRMCCLSKAANYLLKRSLQRAPSNSDTRQWITRTPLFSLVEALIRDHSLDTSIEQFLTIKRTKNQRIFRNHFNETSHKITKFACDLLFGQNQIVACQNKKKQNWKSVASVKRSIKYRKNSCAHQHLVILISM